MAIVKCLNFNNVVPGGMATLDLRTVFGNTLDRVIIKLSTGFYKFMLKGIRLKANGKIIFDDNGSHVNRRMKYRGVDDDADFITLDFSELVAKTVVGQRLGSIDTTLGIESLVLECDIAADAPTPKMEAWADISLPQAGRPERVLLGKVLGFTHNFGAAGKFPLNIPYGRQGGSLIKRIHLFSAEEGEGAIDAVEVKKNGVVVFEATKEVNDYMAKEFGRVPQPGVFTVDFVRDGNMGNVLNVANATSMAYFANVTKAGNVNVVVEMLDPMANN
ncbi:MAG: hypothetical protein KGZ83_17470 [Sulfuricella sp.]|nr:hypothetical protein [Sulfuricella sp.]